MRDWIMARARGDAREHEDTLTPAGEPPALHDKGRERKRMPPVDPAPERVSDEDFQNKTTSVKKNNNNLN